MSEERYTKEYLTYEFWRWVDENGRTPKREDMKHKDGYPNSKDYCRIFNLENDRLWQPILDIMGITRKREVINKRKYKYDDWTKEDILNFLKEKSKELNKKVRKEDVNSYISTEKIMRTLDVKSWTDVQKLCRLETTKKREYSIEEGLNNLKEIYEELGYVPSRNEYMKKGYKPSYGWYRNKFGSMELALKEINVDVDISNEELLQILRDLNKKLNQPPPCTYMRNENNVPSASMYYGRFKTMSWNEILSLAGLNFNHFIGYSKEESLNKLKDYYDILGRIPSRQDFIKNNWLPNYHWYTNNFEGNFKNACWELGLCNKPLSNEDKVELAIEQLINLADFLKRTPTIKEYSYIKNKVLDRRNLERFLNLSYNKICEKYLPVFENDNKIYDLNGEICNSIIEKDITNYFITNNIKYEKEVPYKKLIKKENNRKTSRRLDWVIEYNNRKYFVEYFGYWRTTTCEYKVVKDYIKKTKKKIKDLYKEGLINNSIFIFPNDIKSNTVEGLEQKLKSIFMQKFNISLEKVA